MSAIDALLGPASGHLALNPRTLLVDEDVIVHLQEDESREEVTIYSVPGRMRDAEWLDPGAQPWSHAVPLGSDDRAVSVVTVNAGTRDVFLSDVWPRAALDAATFGTHLSGHARRHRLWRMALQAVEGSQPADQTPTRSNTPQ